MIIFCKVLTIDSLSSILKDGQKYVFWEKIYTLYINQKLAMTYECVIIDPVGVIIA